MNFLKKSWKGLLLSFTIALSSWWLGHLVPVVGGPVFGILIGMVIAFFIRKDDSFKPGITFASKKNPSICSCAARLWHESD